MDWYKRSGKQIFNFGIGDLSKPISNHVINSMISECESMKQHYKGYPPTNGLIELRELLSDKYSRFGAKINSDEIFITDGAKEDLFKILSLFDRGITVCIPNPSYPAYYDLNYSMGNYIRFNETSFENGFLFDSMDYPCNILYLCSPNNPSGEAYTFEQLESIVQFAIKNKIIIIYDASYCNYIVSNKPKTIFSIKDAKKVAIEINSFSKNYGFTGLRCGYTVIPKNLYNYNKMYSRINSCCFNGVNAITQKGAIAALSQEGEMESQINIDYYLDNAKMIREMLDSLSISYCGGVDSPYIFVKCPDNYTSLKIFNLLLFEGGIICSPGYGFGKNGEGYFRLSSLGNKEKVKEGLKILQRELKLIY